MARLTRQSEFLVGLGAAFFLIWGFLYGLPSSIHGDFGWVTQGMFFLVVTSGIAYTIKWLTKVRSWNTVAQWFVWLCVVLPILDYLTFGH